ncbi:hypothetical protein [Legionella waltersii]|uniref:Dihydroorotate dehydrogenase electron transfer subunit n=1 Tax=Legionella waltersii TaxID=66969 RepID=A0A0W1A139_9GAMM|nr:hypothetical protein [Legionella waltersii]KTD74937.1 dihydroorotate dehydrogenase electron transfer subunit [Legionella waltersii]SNV08626.1 dihydroorotate dehydrogenase electron transfer subunit [Legionella waltersii]
MLSRHEAQLIGKSVHGESQVYTLNIENVSPKDCKSGQYVVVHGDKKPIYLAVASGPNDSYVYISQLLKGGAKNILTESAVNAKLQVDAPCGNEFKPVGQKVLLICAGSAESIMRNIYMNLWAQGKEVSVIYSAKRLEDLPFPKLVKKLNCDSNHYITLTEETGGKFKSGRITEHLKTRKIDPETSVFVCGPAGFENDVVNTLLEKSHPAKNISISYWGKILPVDSADLVKRGFKLKKEESVEKKEDELTPTPQI